MVDVSALQFHRTLNEIAMENQIAIANSNQACQPMQSLQPLGMDGSIF
jgi:hypothetical protein